jgi:N utilization substance protein A
MIKLSSDAINLIKIFEARTGAVIKDCIIQGNEITFIVKEGDIGLAIGKKGSVVNRIKKEFEKEIHIYEHSENPSKFISNILFPIKVEKIDINGKDARVHIDKLQKKRAIGKGGKKINTVKELVLRHFGIENVVVT